MSEQRLASTPRRRGNAHVKQSRSALCSPLAAADTDWLAIKVEPRARQGCVRALGTHGEVHCRRVEEPRRRGAVDRRALPASAASPPILDTFPRYRPLRRVLLATAEASLSLLPGVSKDTGEGIDVLSARPVCLFSERVERSHSASTACQSNQSKKGWCWEQAAHPQSSPARR